MSDLVSEDHILARIASHFPNEGPDAVSYTHLTLPTIA